MVVELIKKNKLVFSEIHFWDIKIRLMLYIKPELFLAVKQQFYILYFTDSPQSLVVLYITLLNCIDL